MEKLYEFYWDYGRMGVVEGVFIAEEQQVKDAIGQELWFGEILGKHSEVYGILREKDITEKEISNEALQEIKKIFGNDISGYNPLDYLPENEEEDEE